MVDARPKADDQNGEIVEIKIYSVSDNVTFDYDRIHTIFSNVTINYHCWSNDEMKRERKDV